MIMLKKLAWIFSGCLKSVKIQQLDKTSFDVYLFNNKKCQIVSLTPANFIVYAKSKEL